MEVLLCVKRVKQKHSHSDPCVPYRPLGRHLALHPAAAYAAWRMNTFVLLEDQDTVR